MFKKIKAWIRRKQTEIKAVTTNQRGEFYVDKVIGMIIAVAEGNCDRRLAACRTVRFVQQYGSAGTDG